MGRFLKFLALFALFFFLGFKSLSTHQKTPSTRSKISLYVGASLEPIIIHITSVRIFAYNLNFHTRRLQWITFDDRSSTASSASAVRYAEHSLSIIKAFCQKCLPHRVHISSHLRTPILARDQKRM